jgi:sensor histidine kinase regulating citrate/malate metabolism
MLIPRFRNWRIQTKLIAVTLFLVLVSILCVSTLSIDRFNKALRTGAEQDLGHLVTSIYAMCQIQQEMSQETTNTKERIARSFREEIKRIKVGDTGYVYIMDSKGNLKVHPAKE